ncbi:MAG: Calx-beta domain-containing protein [Planctomycetota bacterium]
MKQIRSTHTREPQRQLGFQGLEERLPLTTPTPSVLDFSGVSGRVDGTTFYTSHGITELILLENFDPATTNSPSDRPVLDESSNDGHTNRPRVARPPSEENQDLGRGLRPTVPINNIARIRDWRLAFEYPVIQFGFSVVSANERFEAIPFQNNSDLLPGSQFQFSCFRHGDGAPDPDCREASNPNSIRDAVISANVGHFIEGVDFSLENGQFSSSSAGPETFDDFEIIYLTPTLTIQQTNGSTVVSEGGVDTFEVTLTPPPAPGKTVSLTMSHNGGNDFSIGGNLVFNEGESKKTFSVVGSQNTLDQFDRTYTLNVGINEGNSDEFFRDVPTTSIPVTVVDDDPAPTVSVTSVTVDEAIGTANFAVSLSRSSGKPIAVSYATADGTAIAGTDYSAKSGRLTFQPGTTQQSVSVSIVDDAAYELTEQFFLNLSSPSNTSIAGGQATGTITDNDLRPKLSILDASIIEPSEGQQELVFEVLLAGESSYPTHFRVSTEDGTAVAPDDYVATTDELTIPAGQNVATFSVLVNADTIQEAEEGFVVRLSDAINAEIQTATAAGQIFDAFPPSVESIRIDDGTNQRSVLRSLEVRFSEEVELEAGAFEVSGPNDQLVALSIDHQLDAGKSVVLLTFSGDLVDASGSLVDGNYSLRIDSTKVRNTRGIALDGDGDSVAGGDVRQDFFRLLGDTDGDRDVDALDLFAFRRSFRTTSVDALYNQAVDFDGDGDVDFLDLFRFRSNYRTQLN